MSDQSLKLCQTHTDILTVIKLLGGKVDSYRKLHFICSIIKCLFPSVFPGVKFRINWFGPWSSTLQFHIEELIAWDYLTIREMTSITKFVEEKKYKEGKEIPVEISLAKKSFSENSIVMSLSEGFVRELSSIDTSVSCGNSGNIIYALNLVKDKAKCFINKEKDIKEHFLMLNSA